MCEGIEGCAVDTSFGGEVLKKGSIHGIFFEKKRVGTEPFDFEIG